MELENKFDKPMSWLTDIFLIIVFVTYVAFVIGGIFSSGSEKIDKDIELFSPSSICEPNNQEETS